MDTLRIFKPDGTMVTRSSRRTDRVRDLVEAVGGPIATINVAVDGTTHTAYVNEDGLRLNLPPNEQGTRMGAAAGHADTVVGNLVLVSAGPDPQVVRRCAWQCGQPAAPGDIYCKECGSAPSY